mgnify:CR=1 FL=1
MSSSATSNNAYPNGNALTEDKNIYSQFLPVIFENIPGELKAQKIWVMWRGVPKTQNDGTIRYTKPPMQPNGRPASSTDKSTWSSFSRVKEAYEKGGWDGIGIMTIHPYVSYDQDHCVDPENGLNDSAIEDLDDLNTYCEISPSGTGVRAFAKGKKPGEECKRGDFEMYDHARFMTVTGHTIEDYPTNIRENQEGIDKVYARRLENSQEKRGERLEESDEETGLTDEEIVEKAMNASNRNKFKRLYNGSQRGYHSPSEADLAFCCELAFWTKDPGQIKRIWLNSGRYRDKLDRDGYTESTIRKALEKIDNHYQPRESRGEEKPPNEKNVYYKDEHDRLKLDEPEIARRIIAKTHMLKIADRTRTFAVYQRGVYLLGAEAATVIKNVMGKEVREASEKIEIDLVKMLTTSVENNILGHIERMADSIKYADWEPNHDIIVVKNGVVDLRTGELNEWSPEYRAINKMEIEYHPRSKCPAFSKWLEEIQPNPEVRRYLQKLAGTFLMHHTMERALYIFLGKGDDGKSVFMHVMSEILGPMYTVVNKCVIIGNDTQEASTELARARFATVMEIHELEKNEMMAEGRVKEISGNDMIAVRELYQMGTQYRPMWKPVLVTNNLPKSHSMSDNLVNRLRIIPFGVVIPPEEQDPNYYQRMAFESEGILAWMVEGAKLAYAEGMKKEPWMEENIESFREKGDQLDGFCHNCLVDKHGRNIGAREMYTAYRDYMKLIGKTPVSEKAFASMMEDKQYQSVRRNKGMFYTNVAFKEGQGQNAFEETK